jgi:dihydrofolate reductase
MSSPAVPQLELIVALAANGVIGRGGTLPWRLPDDLKHFKTMTMGHPILMGRRTYESIGKPLPGRRSIVVSTTMTTAPAPGVEVVCSLDDAVRLVAAAPAFVIGGAALYEAALPRCNRVHLTELDVPVDGDTFFPAFDRSEWRLETESRHEPDGRHAMGFWFRTYVRVGGARDVRTISP